VAQGMTGPVQDRIPARIGSKVRVQYADQDGYQYLGWRGFHPEVIEFGGWITMRRDFADGTISANYPEPPPPKFQVDIVES
jgi:hypothetical protein